MRCWTDRCRRGALLLPAAAVLGSLLVAACSAREDGAHAEIRAATIAREPAPALVADLRLSFSPAMLEALDRGIALRLALRLSGRGAGGNVELERGLKLRYLPLAQQYQLAEESGVARSFARRSQLLAALDRVRVPLPPEWAQPFDSYALELELDTSALPGPLRLPALYEPAWRLSTPVYRWPARG